MHQGQRARAASVGNRWQRLASCANGTTEGADEGGERLDSCERHGKRDAGHRLDADSEPCFAAVETLARPFRVLELWVDDGVDDRAGPGTAPDEDAALPLVGVGQCSGCPRVRGISGAELDARDAEALEEADVIAHFRQRQATRSDRLDLIDL